MAGRANGVDDRTPREWPAGAPSRRLKVALVYDALFPYQKGGAERRYHELALRLRERHEVHQFTWQWWDGPAVVERDGITLHGIGHPPALYGDDGKRSVREAVAFAAKLAPALLRERFDLIDCSATPYLPICVSFLSARIRSTPVVATWHEYWGPYWLDYLANRPVVARVARATERLSVPMADSVVTVSRFTARRLARRLSGRPAPVVVENGISLGAIDQVSPVGSECDVVFVGRLIDDKRVDILLRAIALLRTEHPAILCEIIGEGPERARLETLAAELRLDDNVRFAGAVDERTLFGRLKRARVFALPSVREGFGIAVVEAQACGAVPVVARARHSAAADLIEHGRTGLVCKADPGDFAAAIGLLLSDRSRREAMAEAGLAAAGARDWDCIARQMESVYQSVSAGRGAVAANGATA